MKWLTGLQKPARCFETPITGGNVSFYNETFNEDIYPTPVIGIVGLIEDLRWVTNASFKEHGDRIILLESTSRTETINLSEERALQVLVVSLIRYGLVRSAHDLSEGGFAVALTESCFSTIHRNAIGARVCVPSNLEVCRDMFGEFPSRILVSTASGAEADKVLERTARAGLVGTDVGEVGGLRLEFMYENARAIDLSIEELEQSWREGLENRPFFK